MKPISRTEILGLGEYEQVRDAFRTRVIREKKIRRVAFGPRASCVFENRDTVLLQIQEMIRTERISREDAIAHEIATYNELLPGPHQLSATIMIEIDDKQARDTFLTSAKGLEHSFALVVGGVTCVGRGSASSESSDRTVAVHYVKFELAPEAEASFRKVLSNVLKPDQLVVSIRSTHPAYNVDAPLSPSLVAELAVDLAS